MPRSMSRLKSFLLMPIMSPSMSRQMPFLLTLLSLAFLYAGELIWSGFEKPVSLAFLYSLALLSGFGREFNQVWSQLDAQGKRMRQLEEELASLRRPVTDSTNASDGIRLP
ncbi:MAG TPA: hypothetical protein VMG10_19865 [Gemmataceae bacterium]|nr:hypothetical protein [Gemmataceae bacterium]